MAINFPFKPNIIHSIPCWMFLFLLFYVLCDLTKMLLLFVFFLFIYEWEMVDIYVLRIALVRLPLRLPCIHSVFIVNRLFLFSFSIFTNVNVFYFFVFFFYKHHPNSCNNINQVQFKSQAKTMAQRRITMEKRWVKTNTKC